MFGYAIRPNVSTTRRAVLRRKKPRRHCAAVLRLGRYRRLCLKASVSPRRLSYGLNGVQAMPQGKPERINGGSDDVANLAKLAAEFSQKSSPMPKPNSSVISETKSTPPTKAKFPFEKSPPPKVDLVGTFVITSRPSDRRSCFQKY